MKEKTRADSTERDILKGYTLWSVSRSLSGSANAESTVLLVYLYETGMFPAKP